MAIVVSPVDDPIPEIDGDIAITPIVLTFSDDDPAADPILDKVEITSVTIDHPATLSVVFTDTVVTITGQVNGLFDYTLTYLDAHNKVQVVSKWEDIPQGFNALTQYLAPTLSKKSITITTNFKNHPSFDYDVIVNFRFAPANLKLTEYVKRGKF